MSNKILQELVDNPPLNECAEEGTHCVFCGAEWSQAKAQFTGEGPIVHQSDCLIIRAREALLLSNKIQAIINVERQRQIDKYGTQETLYNLEWLAILAEEFGEVSKCVVIDHVSPIPETLSQQDQLLVELIQTAAVCCAWAEQLTQGEDYESVHRRIFPKGES